LFDECLKLFLGGYGLASFRMLERQGLLQHVFPATARVLAGGTAPHFRRLVERTLASTDERVREDKPVTPAFLFAALLWEPVRVTAQGLADGGTDVASAWTHAVDRVLHEQAQRVAIPRRFTLTIEEIWSLQPRFTQRTRKRAFKLLEHPRFRAAYDFLVLRAEGSPQLTELATWWTEAQEVGHDELAARLAAVPASASADSAPAPAARKRARRRRKPKPSASSGTPTQESGD
jgi:poly(A) polymerase